MCETYYITLNVYVILDESGSDSEAAESTSSSYSSLSDFVSEMASSDLSPGRYVYFKKTSKQYYLL